MPTPNATDPTQEPLHLVSQRGQPYGSVQRCCEVCARMIQRGLAGGTVDVRYPPEGLVCTMTTATADLMAGG